MNEHFCPEWTSEPEDGNEPEIITLTRKGNVKGIASLLGRGGDVNATTLLGTTALMVAAQKGNKRILKQLLSAGAVVDAKESYMGLTALMYAAMSGNMEVLKILLASGASVEPKASDPNGLLAGSNAIRLAAMSGNEEVVELLESVIKDRPDKK